MTNVLFRPVVLVTFMASPARRALRIGAASTVARTSRPT